MKFTANLNRSMRGLRLLNARLVPAALMVAVSCAAGAQQGISLAEADSRGSALFAQSAVTGMVMVVVRNHEVMIRGYGETSPGSGVKPDASSLIRLCSLSKVFTADVLARLVTERKVGLSDPLEHFAPHGKGVPVGPAGQRIRLLDLATHTSGLAREVGAYPAKTPHFTFPDYAYRWTWLPKQKLAHAPGTAALYSNVGFDLLGDALASATGRPYTQLLNESIVRPLGLRDTTLMPSPNQCARLIRGSGDEGPCTDTQASAASGGVYSTGTDMARVLEYFLHISGMPAVPAKALDVYVKPQQLRSMQGLSHAGDPTGIGLAWIQLGDPSSPSVLMEKTGGGAGFSTYIALSPKQNAGIFLAVTEGKGEGQVDFYHEANNLLAALANVPPLPPRVRPAPAPRRRRARRKRHSAAA